jgi:feruloyl esterase
MRLIALLVSTIAFAGDRPPVACESLADLKLQDTKITAAQAVPAGSFTPPGEKAVDNLPAFCRVAGILTPSADSSIRFEVWLPASGWNHKFQGIGNGGFAGSISYGTGGLGNAISRGYAAGSTDTGHNASGVDAKWALKHPEKIVDYGHRAVHEMTVKGKAITAAYYGEAPRHSYFASCSNGGRQALMEAQRYPNDYDGIISGAPANFWTQIIADFVWDTQALMGPGFIPPAKLRAVEKAVLDACDARDGAKDGVIEDPRKCGFDPSTLTCTGTETNDCLTTAQVSALKKIYGGPHDSKGNRIGQGFEPGAETGTGGWGLWITGQAPAKSLQSTFASQALDNMVFDGATWDYKTFDFDRDMKTVNDRMAAVLNATNPDLSAFQKHGGKLILFHGWNDAALPPRNTIDYYNSVRSKMGARVADGFVRLYMIPNLQHCFGGPGATYCGGLTAAMGDASHDLSAALERWVEEGVAPGPVVASQFKTQFDFNSAVLRTHLICPFPQTAVYKGSGGMEDASSFECRQ